MELGWKSNTQTKTYSPALEFLGDWNISCSDFGLLKTRTYLAPSKTEAEKKNPSHQFQLALKVQEHFNHFWRFFSTKQFQVLYIFFVDYLSKISLGLGRWLRRQRCLPPSVTTWVNPWTPHSGRREPTLAKLTSDLHMHTMMAHVHICTHKNGNLFNGLSNFCCEQREEERFFLANKQRIWTLLSQRKERKITSSPLWLSVRGCFISRISEFASQISASSLPQAWPHKLHF